MAIVTRHACKALPSKFPIASAEASPATPPKAITSVPAVTPSSASSNKSGPGRDSAIPSSVDGAADTAPAIPSIVAGSAGTKRDLPAEVEGRNVKRLVGGSGGVGEPGAEPAVFGPTPALPIDLMAKTVRELPKEVGRAIKCDVFDALGGGDAVAGCPVQASLQSTDSDKKIELLGFSESSLATLNAFDDDLDPYDPAKPRPEKVDLFDVEQQVNVSRFHCSNECITMPATHVDRVAFNLSKMPPAALKVVLIKLFPSSSIPPSKHLIIDKILAIFKIKLASEADKLDAEVEYNAAKMAASPASVEVPAVAAKGIEAFTLSASSPSVAVNPYALGSNVKGYDGNDSGIKVGQSNPGNKGQCKSNESPAHAIQDKVWKPDRLTVARALKDGDPSKPGPKYFVFNPIVSPVTGLTHYIVLLDLPSSAWSVKPGLINGLFSCQAKAMKYDLPAWQTSFKEISIRKVNHGGNEYKRTKKGRTVNKMFYTLSLTSAELPMLNQIILSSIQKFERLFHKDSDIGFSCLTYLKVNAPGIVDYYKQSKPTDVEVENTLNAQLVSTFKGVRHVSYGTSFDRYLMDYDIKEFLTSIGITSWEDMKDDLSKVYKYYPSITLTPWDAIQMVPYDE